MKTLIQMLSRGKESRPQPLEDLLPQSKFGRRCSLLSIIPLFMLAVSGTLFVGTAASHPGVDPEIEEVTHELEEDPNRVDLWIQRGRLYRSGGAFNESLKDFEQAKQLAPDKKELILERGLTLSAMGRDVDAEVEFGRFLESESSSSGDLNRARVVALAERGHIRARTGREESAIADFTAALEMRPAVGLYLARGKTQESLGDLDAAAAGYREGLAKIGNVISLKKALIRVETARNRYDEVLRLIDEELTRTSVKTPWYLHRAEILTLMGQVQAARLARQQALEETNRVLGRRPTALNRVSRAKVYIAMGNVDAAKRDLQLAVQIAPHFAEAGELLRKLEGR